MTDYELLSTFIEFINTTWMIFTAYVSIVFAFLVAGYLVSSKLTPKMISLVVSIYSLVAFWAIFALNRNVVAISAASAEIKRVVQEADSSLSWVPIVSIPDVMNTAVPVLVTIIAIVAYLGSVLFFFYQRKNSPSDAS